MKKALGLASLLLVMAGCSETETLNDGVRFVTVSANMEESGQTRSLAVDGGGFVWSKGDAIAIYTSSGSFREFTMNQAGGSSSASFSGAYIGGETSGKCAAYPYNESHTVSGNTLSYNLPTTYGSFDTDYTPNTNAPMVARFEDGSSNFNFCHIGGVFKFTFNNVPKNAAQFVFTAKDKDITGSYDVDLSSGESPYIAAKEKGTSNSVTINFKPLTVVQNDMVIYVPLPTGTYKGFTLAFNKQDGTELVSFNSNGTNTLNRKDLIKFPILQFADVDSSIEGEQEAGTLVNGVAKLAEAGTLATVLGDQKLTLTSLKVVGEINGTDVKCLRQMLCCAASQNAGNYHLVTYYGNPGVLTDLDLSDAKIVDGGDSYYQEGSYPTYTKQGQISDLFFHYSKNLKSLKLPEDITAIGRYAFCECENLENINIPENVTKISGYAFYRCFRLPNITIPENVSTIGGAAFYQCAGFTSVTIPNGVKNILSQTFCGCSNLVSVSMTDNVTSIEDEAFKDCTKLANITIPNGLTYIGDGSFRGCTSLKDFVIPNTVSSLSQFAFAGCTALENVEIPCSMSTMGKYAFSDCAALKSVVFTNDSGIASENKLTGIPESAFRNCTSLNRIDLPNGIKNIYNYAFSGCSSLKIVNIPNYPDYYMSIYNGVFDGCNQLTSVYCNATLVPYLQTIASGAFTSATLYVPSELLTAYKDSDWATYFTNIQAIP